MNTCKVLKKHLVYVRSTGKMLEASSFSENQKGTLKWVLMPRLTIVQVLNTKEERDIWTFETACIFP